MSEKLPPSQPVLDPATMREADRLAIETFGIPGRVLMECAGREVAFEAQRLLACSARPAAPVVVICGPGNNGGDGFVISRTLLNRGIAVHTCFVGHPSALVARADTGSNDDARANYRVLETLGHPVHMLRDRNDLHLLRHWLDACGVIVDALFGTGLSRVLDTPFPDVIAAMNAAQAKRLAVDIPSGLDAHNGTALGALVYADETVTFAALKRGMTVGMGPQSCGVIRVVEMGIPRSIIEKMARATDVGGPSPCNSVTFH